MIVPTVFECIADHDTTVGQKVTLTPGVNGILVSSPGVPDPLNSIWGLITENKKQGDIVKVVLGNSQEGSE